MYSALILKSSIKLYYPKHFKTFKYEYFTYSYCFLIHNFIKYIVVVVGELQKAGNVTQHSQPGLVSLL